MLSLATEAVEIFKKVLQNVTGLIYGLTYWESTIFTGIGKRIDSAVKNSYPKKTESAFIICPTLT
jgi:hypothetical protein